ncbi:MAG: non-ribosomal peptide synthetase [Ruminococcus sp.]|nr:non-ribosomal peptide synthetase [Ruminococcus sp.]
MELNNISELSQLYQGSTVTGNTLDRSVNLIFNFINAASRYPERTAVDGDVKITYSEFLDKVKRTAGGLVRAGICQGDRVGVYCRHTVNTLALIYAVLYIGAVYVPISSDYPEERLQYIRKKSEIKCVAFADGTAADGLLSDMVFIDEIHSADEIPQPYDGTEQYAYCMFTSGTTGEPKGVLIKQAYLLNMCEWYGERFGLDTESRLILLNNFGFDGSLKTIFTPLLYGSCIVLASDSLFDVKDDSERIEKYSVTHLACVPSLIQGILEYCEKSGYKELETVRYLISAGEKFRSRDVLKWLRSGNCNAEFINLYGPAECSCCVSYHNVTEKDLSDDIVPIGKPIYNKRVYVLDDGLKSCPAGAEGDIWIAGMGTFDGYIGMNAEESNLYPDIADEGLYMYLSGDRGIRLENGEILYSGRRDNQIKISGQRIETEEIEQVLSRHEKVTSCGLCIKQDGAAAKTVMFYTTADGNELDFGELSEFMEKSLAKGVIPNRFIHIEKLPVNINGKLDRKALESLDTDSISSVKYVSEDTDEFTGKLLRAWKNTLETEDVPLDSGFFELGGYSMLLYRLQSEIKELLGKDITPAEILAHPTVRSMSAFLRGDKSEDDEAPARNGRVRRIRRR